MNIAFAGGLTKLIKPQSEDLKKAVEILARVLKEFYRDL